MKCKRFKKLFHTTNDLFSSFLAINPDVSDDCIFDYFRRPFSNQGLGE